MKVVFMGTPGFAVPALRRLIESKDHDVAAVVTQPDKPVGRGRKIQFSPVKELALEHNLTVLQPERIKKSDFDKVLSFYNPDVIVVVAYGQILPSEILNLPKYGCLNIHASLLPYYRGAAPIQWAISNGEFRTGVTIMQMDVGLDTGNIVSKQSVDILDDDDTHSITNLLSVMGAELLVNTLTTIEAEGKVTSSPQDHEIATYAPILKKQDGLLNWDLFNEQLICRIKGMQPWPGAFSFLNGRAWKITKAEVYNDESGLLENEVDERGKKLPPRDAGTVIALVKGEGFIVKTGDGFLLITGIQPPDKKTMEAKDAVNGKLIKVGDIFISDPAFLEGSR